MAAYPTLNTQAGSQAVRSGGHEPQRATNGSLKVRRLYASEKTEFVLEHWLTGAEKSTLESFYGTNKDLDVTYTWPGDGAAYTVRFVAPPQYTWMPWGFVARVRLMQT